MRKLLLASAAVVLVTTPVLAADLPTRKSPPAPVVAPVPSFTWTGCSVGAHGGGGWAQKDLSDFTFPLNYSYSASTNPSGWLVGGQVGCDYQFASSWVAGIQGSASWTNIRGTSDPFFGGKAVFQAQTDWIASATGRFGYTWNQWLFYARGGGAWAADKYAVSGSFAGDPFDLTGSETRFGWTIGGGVEWAFWQHWSANLEYAYYDFGNRSISFNGPIDFSSGAEPGGIKQTVQTVTLGISYHF